MLSDGIGVIVAIPIALVAIYLMIWLLFLLPADMARERHRDPAAWVLVSLLGSPFLAIFLLWLLDDYEE